MKIGILGLGSIGQRHSTNLISMGHEVLGFDPSHEAIEKFTSKGGIIESSREKLYKNSDVIIICSPSNHHKFDLEDAINFGKHVFVEKPLSHCEEGLSSLLKEAERKKLIVFSGLNLRYHSIVEKTKNILASDVLGNIIWARFLCGSFLPNWRPHMDYSNGYAADPKTGGVLFDIIHEFDLIYNLLGQGQIVSSIARNSGFLKINSEDCADVIIHHENQAISTLHVDYLTRPARRTYEIAGEKGIIEADLIQRTLKVYDINNELIDSSKCSGNYDEDYKKEMEDFLNCIENKIAPPCTPSDAFYVLKQVLDARKKAGLPA